MVRQCFICREWSGMVSKAFSGVELCLPCYVDILEVRQARGAMGALGSDREPTEQDGRACEVDPGRSPSPFRQLDLFD